MVLEAVAAASLAVAIPVLVASVHKGRTCTPAHTGPVGDINSPVRFGEAGGLEARPGLRLGRAPLSMTRGVRATRPTFGGMGALTQT